MTKNQISLVMIALGLAAMALTRLVPDQTATLVPVGAYLFGVATKRLGAAS
jgi:hypothetical protein